MESEGVKRFEEFLKGRGLNLTGQRRAIVEHVFDDHEHFTADGLTQELRDRGIAASKATVYRTLALLLESDLLESHDFQQGFLFYEPKFGQSHHDHLFCVSCGEIKEFQDERIEELQERVSKKAGYKVLSHTHKVFGLCPKCRGKGPPNGTAHGSRG